MTNYAKGLVQCLEVVTAVTDFAIGKVINPQCIHLKSQNGIYLKSAPVPSA